MEDAELRCIVAQSRCVREARKKLWPGTSDAMPNFRELDFGPLWGGDYSFSIPCIHKGRQVGSVSRLRGYGKDCVKDYLILRVSTVRIEVFALKANPRQYILSLNEGMFGIIWELEVSDSGSFWKRLFRPNHKFVIEDRHKTLVGRVSIDYPISSADKLILCNEKLVKHPVYLAPSRSNWDHNKLIADECPPMSEEFTSLFLAVSLCFRFIVCSVHS